MQVVLDDVGRARFAEFVRGRRDAASRRRPTPTTAWPGWPRWPRPTRVAWSTAPSARHATRRHPPWWRRWLRRAPSGAIPPRPAARHCARRRQRWLDRRFGVSDVPADTWPPASGPRSSWPRCRTCSSCAARTRHRPLPGGLVPDVRHGRALAGCGPSPCRRAPAGRRPRPRGDRARRRRAGPGAVGQLAVEPDRRPRRPRRRRPGAAASGVPVFSDECYAEFTWAGPPRSILEHGFDGVVAVHSLSKRSNLAGVRVGLLRRRPRARRVPARRAPARRADGARARSRPRPSRPRRRRARRGPARPLPRRAWTPGRASSAAYGVPGRLPEGAFYLWVPVPGGRWPTAGPWPRRWPPRRAVGQPRATSTAPAGAGFVRIAVVQPD